MRRNKTIDFNTQGEFKDLLVNQDISNTEFIYYEAVKYNNSNFAPAIVMGDITRYAGLQTIPAEFSENRVAPIIYKSSEYKVAVSSFSIPASTIPLFFMKTNNDPTNLLGIGDNYQMEVRFNQNAYDYSIFRLATKTLFSPISTPTLLESFYVYNYNTIIDEMNLLFAQLFGFIVATYNSLYGVNAYQTNTAFPQTPVFVNYDPATDLFSFYSDARIYTAQFNVGFKFDYALNNQLFNLFQGIPLIQRTDTDNSIDLNSNQNFRYLQFKSDFSQLNIIQVNSVSTIKMTQQYSSSGSWYSFNKILLISNEIGARSVNTATDKYYNNSSNGLDNTAGIIASFDLSIDNSALNGPNSPIIYSPPFLHWIDMFRDNPLYNIDLKFVLIDNQGNQFDYKIRASQGFDVKLVFARKFF